MSLPPPPPFFCCGSSWEVLPDELLKNRYNYAVATSSSSQKMKQKIFIVGGFGTKENTQLASCHVFDIKTQMWEQLPSMLKPRQDPQAVWSRDTLYVMGGRNQQEGYIQSAECITFHDGFSSQDGWQELPFMMTETIGWLKFSAFLVLNNKIIVSGGIRGAGSILQTVKAFDPIGLTCTSLPNMLQSRMDHTMATVNNMIYTFGGFRRQNGIITALNTAECYNATTRTWESLPDMPCARARGSAVSVGHYILLIGGHEHTSKKPIYRVDCFDTISRRWVDAALPPLCQRRSEPGAVCIGSKVFVVGAGALSYANTMERIEINPYYVMAPKLLPFLEQDLPLGIWPHILASCSAPSVIHYILSSNKFRLDSVLLYAAQHGENK